MKSHASMNRIYRLVWNQLLNAWVAVAETARGRGKGPGRKLVVAALSLTAALAQAAPDGGQVVSGAGSIAQSGSTTTVTQSSQNLSLNWKSFNIAPQETVNFVQPSAAAIAVNRIFDTNGSQILGHLNANGQVWLINPNGILFGQNAQVNVGGLVASTLDLNDASLNGSARSFSGNGTGSIVNQGTINAADGGYVALLGNTVSNQGTISAQLGTVALGAGSAATLTFSGNSLVQMQVDQSTLNNLSENGGLIRADGGTVLMSAGAKNALLASVVNNTGVIEARTVENHEGVITLLGGMTAGTVNVGGTLDASAPSGGNGGFVETSAASVKVANDARVTTAAATGRFGNWLIDPQDYTVAASGDISGAALSTNLGTTPITLQSSGGGTAGSGNVNVNDAVSWSANTTLTLTASNNVNINANIAATGNTAGLVINPNTGNGSEAASGVGVFNLNNGAAVTLSGTNPSLSIAGNVYTVINSLGEPYSTTATDLQGMNGNRSGYYALGSNIDATATAGWNSGAGFIPIGGWYTGSKFTGTFDGLGHTICNLSVNWGTMYIGLFGYADRGSVIQNVGLIGASVTGGGDTGALAGYNAGSIKNSYATGTVTGTGSASGGLVGENAGATIDNSYATATVSGNGNVGGLVGNNNTANVSCTSGPNCHSGSELVGSTVSNSYATGAVNDSGGVVGGLVGNNTGSTIKDSFATGSVTATDPSHRYAGGLLGYNDGTASVVNSYATGNVTAYYSVGGLLGLNYGRIDNSYATGIVSGDQFVGGLAGYNSNGYSAGTINNSYATGSVSGHHGIGGLVGESFGGAINISYASGNVTGTFNPVSGLLGDRIGGLVGSNFGPVNNSYASGSVTGEVDVGGLLGLNFSPITNSGATGNVTGTAEVGGLVGTSYNNIDNSFAKGRATGNSSSLDIGGLVGRNWGGTISTSFAAGSVTAGPGSTNLGGLVGNNTYGSISSGSWNTDLIATGVGSGPLGGATGLVTGTMPAATLFANFHFTTTPGASGNNWVVVDADGTLNNAGGAASATLPMLASEYSTTIKGAHQLQLIQMAPAASYTLGANIAALPTGNSTDVWGSLGFVPVGARPNTFAGSFDGMGHTISDLTINRPTQDWAGLFAEIGGSGSVRNVGLLGGSITGKDYVGGLTGWNYGSVSNVYTTGSVSGAGFYAGGLVGVNYGSISNVYGAGNASGYYVGGVLAMNYGSLNNAYATGSVGGNFKGELVGYNYTGTVSNSYWNSSVNATGIGFGTTTGATGLTTAQMQQQSNYPSWDFANTWVMYEGHTAPLLRSFMTPLTVTANNGSKTYDGQAFTESVTYCCTPGGTLPSGMGTINYDAGSSEGATNAGSYTIAPGGLYSNQQGYLISYVNGALTINKAPLTISTLDVTKTYDGSLAASGTATVTSGTLYANAGNGGTVDSISGGTFAFTDKNVGSGNKTVTTTGVTLSDGNGGGNYDVSYVDNTTSTINKAQLSISTSDVTKTYNGTPNDSAMEANGTAIATGGTTLFSTDTLSGGIFAYTDKNVGSGNKTVTTASVTVNDGNSGGNYNIGYVDNTTSTITPKAITATGITANDKVYNGNAVAILDTGAAAITGGARADDDNKFYTGDAITLDITSATGVFTLGKDVATGKAVTVSGLALGNNAAGNYTLTDASLATADITPAHLTVTADDKTRLYGAANPALTTTVSGFITGENAGNAAGYAGAGSATTTAGLTTNVGTAVITAGANTLAASNYDFMAANGTLTIGKAHLTVTADDKSRLYGAVNPTLTTSVSGFVNGETVGTAAGLTGAGSATTLAGLTTNAGTAVITAGANTLAATNYDFTTLVNGILTINPAALVLNSVTPPEPVHIATSQIQSEFTLFNPLDQHQTLLLSPTIGGEANSYLKDVVVVGNKETRINIGGLGPILEIVNGGVRLPGNLVNENE